MKRLAVFHPSTELYGADRIMVLAAKALTNYKTVIYLPKSGKLVDYIKQELPDATIKIVPDMPIISRAMFTPSGIISTLKKAQKFKKYIRDEQHKIGYSKFYVNTLACALILPLIKNLKATVFTHVHEILERPKIAAWYTAKLAFKYSDKVISVSEAVQNNLHRVCKNRTAKSIIVHNGISGIHAGNSPLNNGKTSFYLFGRIKPEKGQWYLLEALSLIPKEILTHATFTLVGSTVEGQEYLKDELNNLTSSYGLSEQINMIDFVDDISLEMAKANVCLVPSLMKDPFPTTVLEAMSAKKAIITTDIGGAKEAVKNQHSGIIVPPNKPAALATAIQSLITQPELRKNLASNAEKQFLENFTKDHFNKRWQAALL